MMDSSKLPRVRDADKESQYGYVHAVSGPGKFLGVGPGGGGGF